MHVLWWICCNWLGMVFIHPAIALLCCCNFLSFFCVLVFHFCIYSLSTIRFVFFFVDIVGFFLNSNLDYTKMLNTVPQFLTLYQLWVSVLIIHCCRYNGVLLDCNISKRFIQKWNQDKSNIIYIWKYCIKFQMFGECNPTRVGLCSSMSIKDDNLFRTYSDKLYKLWKR